MIKIVACDMDGTLLNGQHKLTERTIKAIKKICGNGIRFIIVTGRNFQSIEEILKRAGISCDYIVNSGGEIRDPDKKIIKRTYINYDDCRRIFNKIDNCSVSLMFQSDEGSFYIGTPEEAEKTILENLSIFYAGCTKEEIKNTVFYKMSKKSTWVLPKIEDLELQKTGITKIFICSKNMDALKHVERLLINEKKLAVTSSFENNLEITDVKTQKGPVLKTYVESLGYNIDEVMVFGDSRNDLSIFKMDFGIKIAMENAHSEIKKYATYITKSNEEDGVAYILEEMYKHSIS